MIHVKSIRLNLFLFLFGAHFCVCLNTYGQATPRADKTFISESWLKDKIKGGWAGQTIGVTYGGPTEFHYCGMIIPDSVEIPWYDGYLKETILGVPGLFDDIYMDLTFLDVFYRNGLDAPLDSFAHRFAHAEFPLDGANQAARYNILNGIDGSQSGYWKNNPHADDLDFQIEADFIGLMTPGICNTAADISDMIGHIMSNGDGWYGGVYVATMYSLAFIHDDVSMVVREALKAIPRRSKFYQCIDDVIRWHGEHPGDWKHTWQLLEDKWSDDQCPDGAHYSFNIDAKMNAAYVVLGLLYGQGDYGKTLDISTRAGQDSDCNPSTAGGILGTILGYDQIPAYWKMGLDEVEDIDFVHTTISLNDAYTMSYQLATQLILRNGGSQVKDGYLIPLQKPEPVRFEQSFEGIQALERVEVFQPIESSATIEFEGKGVVWRGTAKARKAGVDDYIFLVDVYLDGKKIETIRLPTNNLVRKRDFYWNFNLLDAQHTVTLEIQNPHPDYEMQSLTYVTYGNEKK